MNVSIRKATSNDLESIYLLICELEDQQIEGETFEGVFLRNISDPHIYYLVAEINNRIVGFLSLHVQYILHHSKPTCEIQELNIVPELRGSGIGAKLMDEAEKIAKELNLEEIEITTRIDRERAQVFYHKLGYAYTHNKFVKKLI